MPLRKPLVKQKVRKAIWGSSDLDFCAVGSESKAALRSTSLGPCGTGDAVMTALLFTTTVLDLCLLGFGEGCIYMALARGR